MDRVMDRGDLARYVFQCSSLAFTEMDAHQFRVYIAYKLMCSAGGGTCKEGIRGLAEFARVSPTVAGRARSWLIDNGWLSVAGETGRGGLIIEVCDKIAESFDAAGIPSVAAWRAKSSTVDCAKSGTRTKSSTVDPDPDPADCAKSSTVDCTKSSTVDHAVTSGDCAKSSTVAGDSSHSLPRSSSRSITPDPSRDPEQTTTTTAARPTNGAVSWVSVDSLTDEERAAYDALHDAGLNGSSASVVRTFGPGHCINHAAAYLADSEHNPELRPAVLLWRIQNADAPTVARLPGDWRRWWDRYASRAGLLTADDPAVPADPATAGPADGDDPELLAGMLPELREIVQSMESAGTLGRSECVHWFGQAAGRLEDDGATLRILHPDGAKLHFLQSRLGNRIRLSRPAGVDVIKFGEGEGVTA